MRATVKDQGQSAKTAGQGTRTLRDALPMAASDVAALAPALVRLLGQLHDQGQVHGGLSPQAIQLDAAHTPIALQATPPDPAYQAPEPGAPTPRSDLYALGVLLYAAATGIQPFAATDPLEARHRHLTHLPPPAHMLQPQLPQHLSDLIDALLQKDPDRRPQSAAEVIAALEGRSQRLDLPQDLIFGQDQLAAAMAAQLSAAFAGRQTRLVRVIGPSGAGKSTLIEALDRQSLPPGTRLVQGKFDQLDSGEPYSALRQAFDGLLNQTLAAPTGETNRWRERLAQALGANGQVLLGILPRFQALIGPQPPIPALGLNEAQIRVSLMFRRFLAAITAADAPLLIFLDDLQWADAASLEVIRLILSDPGLTHLVILAAYRSNEVGPGHPVQTLLSQIADLPEPIDVRPLDQAEVAALLTTALNADPAKIAPLARIIARKTAGNPYFIRQLLMAMVRKGLLSHQATGWIWDEDQASAESYTENVVDLVAERIQVLPPAAQDLLRIASCLGSRFDLALLAKAARQEPAAVADQLSHALSLDVLAVAERDGQGQITHFRFLHDRVQQAATALLDAAGQSRIHADLGLLLQTFDPARTIEIVDHLTAGFADLSPAQRLHLRGLAMAQAQRSMASNAYASAHAYLDTAARTLPEDAWETLPELTFDLHLERLKISYLQGHYPVAETLAAGLLSRPLEPMDRARVLEMMVLLETSQLNYLKAIDRGVEALAALGEDLPKSPSLARVLAAFFLTKARNARLSDQAILSLPMMTDPRRLLIMRILVVLCPPAYFTSATLLPLIALKMVRMSWRFGNSADSAYAYSIYAMLHGLVLKNPARALQLGDLALRAIPALQGQANEARILMVYAGFIKHWTAPLTETLPDYLRGAEVAISTGDVDSHGYTRYGHGSNALMAGLPLPRVSAILEEHLAAVTAVAHEKTRRIMVMALTSIYRMRGQTFPVAQDEAANLAQWTSQKDATSLAYFHKYRMLEALMQGDWQGVLAGTAGMQANLNGILMMAYEPFFKFYKALALYHLSASAPPGRRLSMRLRARFLTGDLRRAAKSAPQTFAHRVALLDAEAAVAARDGHRAIRQFDLALAGAAKAGALHDVGVFAERAALFYRAQGATDQADALLLKAAEAHRDWGAGAWVQALAARHPHLDLAAPTQAPAPDRFDSAALIRTSAAIAEAASVDDMLAEVQRSMDLLFGATGSVLLLENEGQLRRASGGLTRWPESLVRVVWRSGETILLADASREPSFASDPYFQPGQRTSVLCAPMKMRGKVIGVVYLENPHLRGAFSPSQARMAEVLAAQAAVALDNARLLQQMRGLLERQVDMTSAHARFVPHAFLDLLGRASLLDVQLGDHVRGQASILFADMRGFTPLLEAMPPDQVLDFVNGFLARIEPAIRDNGGFIDSIIGDAVMAVFQNGNAPIAATAVQRALQTFAPVQGKSLRVGIGIATGELILGTIGVANRLKCGVLGDTVNLAARIEELTKTYGLGCLITDTTLAILPDASQHAIRPVDLVTVRGRQTPVQLYEVFDTDPLDLKAQKTRTIPQITKGLAALQAEDLPKAAALFAKAATLAPQDPLAAYLLARCKDRS